MSAGKQLQTPARTPAGPQTRLPWWAWALPAAAFVALFSLLSSPAQADGSTQAGSGPMARVVQFVQHSAGRLAP
ncbi:hypothetical protein [Streptomyces cinnamoneus]|uniref:Uncharacterized protein n=1 Tax=Streptomyces cinnamoneus TaxID=53446 RepID=A0A918TNU1_STRCJ|nr:hypothetical protein [Streptomyces cinnamoneus]GHC56883.1 hypothetical protein GCM10010507_36960 [Streptomyces cinnamoneus]